MSLGIYKLGKYLKSMVEEMKIPKWIEELEDIMKKQKRNLSNK